MRSKRPGLRRTVASSRWLRWLRAIRELRWVKNGPFERDRFRSVHLKADIRSLVFHFQKVPIVEIQFSGKRAHLTNFFLHHSQVRLKSLQINFKGTRNP